MPSLSQATEPDELVHRLRRVLSIVRLDCECRTTLDGALDRFSAQECRRQVRNGLRQARRERDWIASQLHLLAELDGITERERDHSVFEEIALLFDEIALSAAGAAQAVREARSLSARRGRAS